FSYAVLLRWILGVVLSGCNVLLIFFFFFKQKTAYEMSVAQSGFECLDLFRRDAHAYDLILTDLSMPLMDGEETFQRLRQMSPTANVVLMAGFVDSARLEKMMHNGLSGFVGKPFAPVEILAVVTS